MRVTLLSKALVVGAYQRKCELMAAHDGLELTVLVPPSWGNQPLERTHTTGYELRVLPIRFNGNFHLHYYPTLAAELKRARPDVFHIDEEPYNLATWLAMRAPRARTLFFSWQNINRVYPPPFRWLERGVLRMADAALVGNREAEQVWRAKGFTKPMHVVPQFGVDEDVFCPSPRPFDIDPNGPFTLGFAGRLVHEKGVDVLIRALTKLPTQARLLVAGTGPDDAALRSLAAQLNVASRIEWRGAVPSTHMPAFYREIDALAVPSRTLPNWKEQFGRVIVEAMACGVPVLGAASGEIPNVIGDAGLTVAEDDADAISSQVRMLMHTPAVRAELAHKGRARVLEQFTMRQIAAKTVEVYRGILS